MIPPGTDFRLLPARSLAPILSPPAAHRPKRAAAHQSRDASPARPSPQPEQPDWNSYTCEFLINRILRQQHADLRHELHQLEDITAAAAARTPSHPGHPSHISRVQTALATLAGELDSDFAEEEERLYPRLLDVELAYVGMDCTSARPQPVHASLHHSAHRHGLEEKRLDRIQTAIHSFNPGPAAGTVDHVLWDRLLRFHNLLLTHFHLEDYVLLPRVTRMEAELFG